MAGILAGQPLRSSTQKPGDRWRTCCLAGADLGRADRHRWLRLFALLRWGRAPLALGVLPIGLRAVELGAHDLTLIGPIFWPLSPVF